MCPLRVIVLFLSAMLAGYFAIKSVGKQGENSVLHVSEEVPEKTIEQTNFMTKVSTAASSFFWVTIEMLSGRYLYHNLKGQVKVAAVADG